MDSTITSQDDATERIPLPDPTGPIAAAGPVGAQQCSNCGASLAPDQRYCLECGERRGEPRLPVMTGRPEPATVAATATPSRMGRVARVSSNTALIAGVGTLLVALGVGVLIGRSGDGGGAQKASGVQVVTVSGGAPVAAGPSSTAPAAAATAGATGAAAKAGGKDKANAKAKSKSSDATVPTSGGAVKKTPGKVVKIGSKGHGPGYKNGKFTGDFFGP